MHFSRRAFLPTLIGGASLLVHGKESVPTQTERDPCIATWFTTRGVTSLILGIEPGGEALFLFIENGAFSIAKRRWTEAPGGILVNGFPRFRLWASKAAERIRAEMEEIPAEFDVSKGFRLFPTRFFMKRAELVSAEPNLLNRALPAGWNEPTLPPEWDSTAGKPRQP